MSNKTSTHNPFTGESIKTYNLHTDVQVESMLQLANDVSKTWRQKPIKERSKLLNKVAKILSDNLETYSELMTAEMGKPIAQSRSEIEKCIFLCDFYRKNADSFLADQIIETDAKESFISYDPLGTILAVMPWNYPFWQVMRFAIPTLTAGNTALLKHASNVTGCALIIEELFEKAGYPKGCFQTLLVNHDQVEQILSDDRVKAVSLTGSEKAGRKIAEIAGRNLKKAVLELGGNNACVVLGDANLEAYLDIMVNARMQNTGQSCIAAKRFIVEASIYDEFLEKFTKKVKSLKHGDPTDDQTDFSVLARADLADILEDQVERSLKKGAKVHFGNERKKAYYQPTIITNVTPNMPIFDEETFGPVAAIIKVKDKAEAYEMVANTRFGLGTMIFTEDFEDATAHVSEIEDGAFFINELVKSDPRLPFGGTKASGYGRELSEEGIMEFVNKKTVYINH
ncbi:NAD-dependent succinate-semialdehyde dehydrogenase [Subsaximicrobium wynnwilliamsii]|uniref:NAD-dependent succinate-semialdehyde dehydrogenase n=1 Tax=Subsaximicrobium wynnwilliamsii TaxID=291179 RepID=A0A5C6ZRN8_9FLAO|nr:NAD-dependent succinate-semialdehyde dehydrogenase [Subsaximicrobium wynnwilliamsii]TXD85207.1 NAD-dependent succinate-semialdehyde dehydrogenase [Subsaximicrobium wynnwilliamsii]TXD91250.1 NAD-dependent succinate-semialdehyde dehydrogenase [Subsaximicrobium wynnwilliamsii]TXE04643.1 NAD-dependent succinate-semialdehyde dehydrogenase [Subsaximicrobium wynnwilliamsii]